MIRSVLILTLAIACTGGDDAGGKKNGRDSGDTNAGDADTDSDSDSDSDADTDTDTDTDAPDISTYEGFVEAHAEAWCVSLAACDLLDDQGYADVAACVSGVTTTLSGYPCDSYAQQVAARCISEDLDMKNRCDTAGTGNAPPSCAQVCQPPQ